MSDNVLTRWTLQRYLVARPACIVADVSCELFCTVLLIRFYPNKQVEVCSQDEVFIAEMVN